MRCEKRPVLVGVQPSETLHLPSLRLQEYLSRRYLDSQQRSRQTRNSKIDYTYVFWGIKSKKSKPPGPFLLPFNFNIFSSILVNPHRYPFFAPLWDQKIHCVVV